MTKHAEYQTFRCDHCTGPKKKAHHGNLRPKRMRPSYRRISNKDLYELIKCEIRHRQQIKKLHVTAEEIAERCRVKVHRVKKVFMKLNQEGLMTRAFNRPPHDSRRELGWGHDNSWGASIYYINELAPVTQRPE